MSILWLQSGAGTLGVPIDDDTKDVAGNSLTVTSVQDCDGAYLRPPRVEILHAMDDARNAALGNYERTDMDRHNVRSIRAGRTRNEGINARFLAQAKRAGEALALRELLLHLHVKPGGQRKVTETTSRTDCDGASLVVPTWRVFVSANSAKNSDLQTVATDQDRWQTTHAIPIGQQRALRHRVVATPSGRAGESGCVKEMILYLNVSGSGEVRAKST